LRRSSWFIRASSWLICEPNGAPNFHAGADGFVSDGEGTAGAAWGSFMVVDDENRSQLVPAATGDWDAAAAGAVSLSQVCVSTRNWHIVY
jgi:hypothetical protein